MIDKRLPAVFYPSRLKSIGLLALGLALTFGGVFMIQSGHNLGYFAAVFFGLCTLVFFVNLLPGGAYLLVDDDGFEFASLFWKTRVAWKDVSDFGVVNFEGNVMIGFNFSDDFDRSKAGMAMSPSMGGYEKVMPNCYGQNAEELAEWLATQRKRRLHSAH